MQPESTEVDSQGEQLVIHSHTEVVNSPDVENVVDDELQLVADQQRVEPSQKILC